MRKILIALLVCHGVIAAGSDAGLLVTKPGAYSSGDKKTSIELTSPSPGRLNIQLAFKIQTPGPGSEPMVEVTDSRRVDNLPVKTGWACCISPAGDAWFYDGAGAFTVFQRQKDRVDTLKSCSEPDLGSRAPEVMKQWIAKNTSPAAAPANASDPVHSTTNALTSPDGARR